MTMTLSLVINILGTPLIGAKHMLITPFLLIRVATLATTRG